MRVFAPTWSWTRMAFMVSDFASDQTIATCTCRWSQNFPSGILLLQHHSSADDVCVVCTDECTDRMLRKSPASQRIYDPQFTCSWKLRVHANAFVANSRCTSEDDSVLRTTLPLPYWDAQYYTNESGSWVFYICPEQANFGIDKLSHQQGCTLQQSIVKPYKEILQAPHTVPFVVFVYQGRISRFYAALLVEQIL